METINEQLAALLLKAGVQITELTINHETWPEVVEDGVVRHVPTGASTLTMRIYDPSCGEVK